MKLIWCVYFTVVMMVTFIDFSGTIRPDNPPNMPGTIEGDIIWPSERNVEQSRQGVDFDVREDREWPAFGKGIKRFPRVPYDISGYPSSSSNFEVQQIRETILEAIDKWKKVLDGCIVWVERRKQEDFVDIKPVQGCSSDIGRLGGKQVMSITAGCTARSSSILHEMMHVIGMNHEHNRYDRDDYITVNMDKVGKSYRNEYNKPFEGLYIDINGYDYYSIMHYTPNSTGDGSITIKDPTVDVNKVGRGFRDGELFSLGDVLKIAYLYKCNETKVEEQYNAYIKEKYP